jgi:hypothetical protein
VDARLLREGWKARLLDHASRLLEVPALMSDDQPTAIEHAVRDERDERRDHNAAGDVSAFERPHSFGGLALVDDEARDDLFVERARSRLSRMVLFRSQESSRASSNRWSRASDISTCSPPSAVKPSGAQSIVFGRFNQTSAMPSPVRH